jgi:hypothetical protein
MKLTNTRRLILILLVASLGLIKTSYAGIFSNTEPKVITATEGAANAGKYLSQALDPLFESFGYQSQENQVLDIMRGVDPLNPSSIMKGYSKVINIAPNYGSEYLEFYSSKKYPGRCPCPYDIAEDGSMCGERSAYSRSGGYEPKCY